MDPFSDIIAILRPHAALSKPISGRGDWGVRYQAYGMPGFALVLDGGCWLSLEGREPVRLDRGDFVLLPVTPAFEMSSSPGVDTVVGTPSEHPVRYGDPDGEPDFRMLGGSFQIERANAPLLTALIPEEIHVRSAQDDTARLARIIDLIMEECAAERAGGESILQRLLEVLLIEALRRESGDTGSPPGLLAGMRNPAIARTIRAIHDDVRGPWTVLDLARIAGMSRSAFAARFVEIVGCGPIEYLARWRMTLAKNALCSGVKSLDRLAEQIGYESASAFSTAFRRRVGCPPGAFARSYRQ